MAKARGDVGGDLEPEPMKRGFRLMQGDHRQGGIGVTVRKQYRRPCPNLLGEGVTWLGRVSKVIQANCGGCHGGASPSLGLDLSGADAYEQLLLPSKQRPEMVLLAPGSLEDSYLWWKLTKHEGIVGQRMPYNPLTGEGELKPSELSDIETWILNGAKREE